jgi:hypothetical protein
VPTRARGLAANALGAAPAVPARVDTSAIAAAAIQALELKFSLSQEQQNQLRMITSLLDGSLVALTTIRATFFPAVGSKQHVFKVAMGHYENIAKLCSLRCRAEPEMQAEFRAALEAHREVRRALTMQDVLAAWIADQWAALFAVHTLQATLPEPLCDYEKLELWFGVPAAALQLFRSSVEVAMMVVVRIVDHQANAAQALFRKSSKGAAATGVPLPAVPEDALPTAKYLSRQLLWPPTMKDDKAAWSDAEAAAAKQRSEVARRQKAVKKAQEKMSRAVRQTEEQEKALEAKMADAKDALQAATDEGVVRDAAAAAALLTHRGISPDAKDVLDVVGQLLGALLKDHPWNTPDTVQFGAAFVSTFKQRLMDRVFDATFDGDQSQLLKFATKEGRERKAKAISAKFEKGKDGNGAFSPVDAGLGFFADMTKKTIGLVAAPLVNLSLTWDEFRLKIIFELTAVFAESVTDGDAALEDLTAATKNVAGTLLSHEADSNITGFMKRALDIDLSGSEMELLDEAIDFYMNRNSQDLDASVMASIFDITGTAMNTFIHPERICKQIAALRGKEFLFRLLQGDRFDEMMAGNAERMNASLRAFFNDVGIHPTRFVSARDRLVAYGTKGAAFRKEASKQSQRGGRRATESGAWGPKAQCAPGRGIASKVAARATALQARLQPVIASVDFSGFFSPDGVAPPALKLAVSKDLVALLGFTSASQLQQLDVAVPDDHASMSITFQVARDAGLTVLGVRALLTESAIDAGWKQLKLAYSWSFDNSVPLALSGAAVLQPAAAKQGAVHKRRLRKLNDFFLHSVESRAEGHHDDLVRTMCHVTALRADELAAAKRRGSVAAGATEVQLPSTSPLDESSIACFGVTEEEAVEASFHLQSLRVMWVTLDAQLREIADKQHVTDEMSQSETDAQARMKRMQKANAAPAPAVPVRHHVHRHHATETGQVIEDEVSSEEPSSSDDDDADSEQIEGSDTDSGDDSASDCSTGSAQFDVYRPLFSVVGGNRVDVKRQTTRRVMALLRTVAPNLHQHLLEQLAEAQRNGACWLDRDSLHLSVELQCLKDCMDHIVLKRANISAFIFHDIDEEIDTLGEAAAAVMGVGRMADLANSMSMSGSLRSNSDAAPAEQALPGQPLNASVNAATAERGAASDIDADGLQQSQSMSSPMARREKARSKLQTVAQKFADMRVKRHTVEESADFAFQAASPFALIDVSFAVPRAYRNLFGVLYGIVAWYPADIAHAYSAIATITVRGRATPIDVITLIASKFPIKIRRLVTGLATLSTGAMHPTLIAVADQVGISFEAAKRVHALLNPRQEGVRWRAGDAHAPAAVVVPDPRADINWFAFLQGLATGNIFALLRYEHLLDTDVQALSVLHANTDRIRKTLTSFYPTNHTLTDILEMRDRVDADDVGAKAFPLLFDLARKYGLAEEDARKLHLVTGTFFMMRSNFDGALTEFKKFCGSGEDPETRRKLLTARIGVLVARLVVEDGAVNDPDAVIGVIIDMLRELPEWLKSTGDHRHERPKNLDAVIDVVAPFAAKYLPMLMNCYQGEDLDDILRKSAADEEAEARRQADEAGGDVYSELIGEMGRVLKVVVRCLLPDLSAADAELAAAAERAKQGRSDFDSVDGCADGDETEADIIIDITVAALVALRSNPTLPDVIDNVIAMISGRHVGSEDELREMATSMTGTARAAMTDGIVQNAQKMNEQIRLLSSQGQGPKFFMGLLSFIIQSAQAKPEIQDIKNAARNAAKGAAAQQQVPDAQAVPAAPTLETAVALSAADAEELLSDDHDKIQLVVAFADGDMSVLAELLKAAGVQPQPQCLQSFRRVLGMMTSLRRMSKSKNLSSFSTNDMMDLVSSEIFKELDNENTGILSYDDFLMALDRMYIDVTDHQARIWFQDIDVDKSGGINEVEFQRAICGILKYLQNQMLEELHLSKTTIYISLTWTAMIMLFLLTFLIMGVYGFTDGTSFSAVITGGIPMLGSAVSTVQDPNQMKMLLARIDAAATVFFERVMEIKRAAAKTT